MGFDVCAVGMWGGHEEKSLSTHWVGEGLGPRPPAPPRTGVELWGLLSVCSARKGLCSGFRPFTVLPLFTRGLVCLRLDSPVSLPVAPSLKTFWVVTSASLLDPRAAVELFPTLVRPADLGIYTPEGPVIRCHDLAGMLPLRMLFPWRPGKVYSA